MRDRAVSDVLGFVLVFALVISTLGVVYVAGFSGLEDARDAERINNAARAFDVLGDNMADVYEDGAPSRKTEIKLSDAQLTLGEATIISVTVNGITDGTGALIGYQAETRPLIFSAGGSSEIVYESGAVIRTDRGGSTLQQRPPLLISEERTIIGYVALSPARGAPTSVGGDGTVLVRAVRSGQSTLVQNQSYSEVTLTIETATERAAVWERYVNERADWANSDWDDGDNVPCETTSLGGGRSRITCTFEPEEIYLTSTGIEMELIV